MKRPSRLFSPAAEPLESRIAPASVHVSYNDVDGDLVTITDSSGTLVDGDLVVVDGQLRRLDLTDPGFQGASITFKVSKGATGNGLADAGHIDATGRDLANVTIKGDLGRIDVGDGDGNTPALKMLTTVSVGRQGLATQGPGANLISNIAGDLGKLIVKTDFSGAWLQITGGDLGSVVIGGSLLGTNEDHSGKITTTRNIGKMKIGGDVVGGSGAFSGHVDCDVLGDVTIGGDVIGGLGGFTGLIRGMNGVGAVKIGGSVIGDGTTTGGGLGDNGFLQAGNGGFKSITIGGSLIGGRGDFSGAIAFSRGGGAIGTLGPVKIAGDIVGGSGGSSGSISGLGGAVSISVGRSIVGGSGFQSGSISIVGVLPAVKVGGDLLGGSGPVSGNITSGSTLGNVTIGGSIRGGSANQSGTVFGLFGMGAAVVKGSLIGGDLLGTAATVFNSGSIDSGGDIRSVTIGRSIVAGTDTSTAGSLIASGSVRSDGNIGALTVGGSLVGNTNPNGDTPVTIVARGNDAAAGNPNLAFGKIAIRGHVDHALILAGYQKFVDAVNTSARAVNGDAQIGPVTVGGNWSASSLVAGAKDVDNDGFGDADDAPILTPVSLGRIASVVIKGSVFGSAGPDRFGFVAPTIGAFKAGNYVAPLTPAPGDLVELPIVTADVTIREV